MIDKLMCQWKIGIFVLYTTRIARMAYWAITPMPVKSYREWREGASAMRFQLIGNIDLEWNHALLLHAPRAHKL